MCALRCPQRCFNGSRLTGVVWLQHANFSPSMPRVMLVTPPGRCINCVSAFASEACMLGRCIWAFACRPFVSASLSGHLDDWVTLEFSMRLIMNLLDTLCVITLLGELGAFTFAPRDSSSSLSNRVWRHIQCMPGGVCTALTSSKKFAPMPWCLSTLATPNIPCLQLPGRRAGVSSRTPVIVVAPLTSLSNLIGRKVVCINGMVNGNG